MTANTNTATPQARPSAPIRGAVCDRSVDQLRARINHWPHQIKSMRGHIATCLIWAAFLGLLQRGQCSWAPLGSTSFPLGLCSPLKSSKSTAHPPLLRLAGGGLRPREDVKRGLRVSAKPPTKDAEKMQEEFGIDSEVLASDDPLTIPPRKQTQFASLGASRTFGPQNTKTNDVAPHVRGWRSLSFTKGACTP